MEKKKFSFIDRIKYRLSVTFSTLLALLGIWKSIELFLILMR